MGKRLFFAVCAALGCVFAGAESLAFQIVQHGGGFTKVAEPSLIVEDEIINSLFDAGFIVSNIPAALSSSKKDDERLFAAGTGEAASNSFDSFLSIHLFFNNQAIQDEKKAELGALSEISWKIADVKSGQVQTEGSTTVEKTAAADSETAVREFARNFASYIRKMLKAKA